MTNIVYKFLFLLFTLFARPYDLKYTFDCKDLNKGTLHIKVKINNFFITSLEIPSTDNLAFINFKNKKDYIYIKKNIIYCSRYDKISYSIYQKSMNKINLKSLIHSNFFNAIGMTFLINPGKNYSTCIKLKNLQNYNFINSLNNQPTFIDDFYDIEKTLFCIGDININYVANNIFLAVHGFDNEEINNKIFQMTNSITNFFSAINKDYLISVFKTDIKDFSDHLLGLSTTEYFIGTYNLQNFYHEFIHRWIPQKMTHLYNIHKHDWFREGFTDYFSYVFLLKNNEITEEKFIKRINQILEFYYTDQFKYRYDYYHGLLFAIYLNDKLIQNKYHINDLILDILHYQSKKDFLNLFIEKTKPFYNNINSDIQKYIINNAKVSLQDLQHLQVENINNIFYLKLNQPIRAFFLKEES